LRKASLLSASATRRLELHVDCSNGRVTLSGKVDSDELRRAADEIQSHIGQHGHRVHHYAE
jgi:osmotically-inducible protein OsmY